MAPRPGGRRHGARRSASTKSSVPLTRGTAVVAAAGGAFTLVGAAAVAFPLTGTPIVPTAQSVGTSFALDGDSAERADRDGENRDGDGDGKSLTEGVEDAISEITTSIEPVVPEDPEPQVADASALVKAAQQAEAEVAKKAAEKAAEAKAAAAKAEAERAAKLNCSLPTGGLGAVKSYVRTAANFLGCQYEPSAMHGVAGRAGTSDHPSGKAIDFMIGRAAGDQLAQCALNNKKELGITYVIWRQRINYGSGWEAMEDRGSPTANHYDHVHVSFGSGAGGKPITC
ncbi:hypothetical protein [Pseudonocardia sp. TRM90224]|uniref:hypothetical protein n=1 Tax=Pseudonocardia sp. TRM90224 TaxID=2812678 RepID=UPI001E55AF7F|nr:hypothetical protein [Pseudonocardia sp. TRM90224]